MFWDNLTAECERQGLLVYPLLKELGISTGNPNSWRKGGKVHSDTLLALSKRLGVSTDYLLTGERFNDSGAFSCANREEEMLLMMYRSIPEFQRAKCYAYIQGMYDFANTGEKSAV